MRVDGFSNTNATKRTGQKNDTANWQSIAINQSCFLGRPYEPLLQKTAKTLRNTQTVKCAVFFTVISNICTKKTQLF